MTTRYTAGPWRVVQTDDSLLVDTETGHIVAWWPLKMKSAHDLANAALIASAPTMRADLDASAATLASLLEAAEGVMDCLDTMDNPVPHLLDTDDNPGWRLRKAILQAKAAQPAAGERTA